MKFSPDTLFLFILFLLLALGMILTLLFGGESSRHGYGYRWDPAEIRLVAKVLPCHAAHQL